MTEQTYSRYSQPRTSLKEKLNSGYAIGATVLALAGIGAAGKAAFPKDIEHTRIMTVRPHDSLWNVVDRADPDDRDIREEVYRIREELGTTTIQPGQKIKVHVRG